MLVVLNGNRPVSLVLPLQVSNVKTCCFSGANGRLIFVHPRPSRPHIGQNMVLGGGDLESTCMRATSTRRSVIDIIDI